MSASHALSNEELFWDLVGALQLENPRLEEGTIMGGRCVRVAGEFLAIIDFKDSGLVIKLPRERVTEPGAWPWLL